MPNYYETCNMDLSAWGYVFWDSDRSERLGILKEPRVSLYSITQELLRKVGLIGRVAKLSRVRYKILVVVCPRLVGLPKDTVNIDVDVDKYVHVFRRTAINVSVALTLFLV